MGLFFLNHGVDALGAYGAIFLIIAMVLGGLVFILSAIVLVLSIINYYRMKRRYMVINFVLSLIITPIGLLLHFVGSSFMNWPLFMLFMAVIIMIVTYYKRKSQLS